MWTKRIATLVATATVAGAFAAPAMAQNQQEGLVNVALEDVTIQVPVAVAANLCDVNVAILARFLDDASACEATADAAASQGPGQGGAAAARSFEPIDLSTVVGAVRLDNDPTTSTGIPL